MNEVDLASKVWGSGGGDAAEPAAMPAADMGDVADFQQWLQAVPQQGAEAADSSALGALLQSTSSSLHEQELRFNKTLRRVAQTGDPVDGLAVQRQMSELYLTHGLTVKVIAKTSQALESLSRLQ